MLELNIFSFVLLISGKTTKIKLSMKDDSMSTRDMLMNISSMRSKAMKLTEKGKAYSDLLKDILARDIFDENSQMPSIKELCKSSGLNYGKVRKYIEDIYHDLVLNYEGRPVFSFTKLRYEFFIRCERRRFMDLEADQLPVVPRVGEAITLPFFSAYLGTVDFFVEKVKHVFKEDVQVVELWLRHGSYNSYWHYRKDKAMEEEELHFIDWLNLEEYELKKKLGVGEKARSFFTNKIGHPK